jgi:hypothetical protein
MSYPPGPGDRRVILSRKLSGWDDFFGLIRDLDVPADFLSEAERGQGVADRDPFEGWRE